MRALSWWAGVVIAGVLVHPCRASAQTGAPVPSQTLHTAKPRPAKHPALKPPAHKPGTKPHAVHKVPVVSPRHAAPPRHAVHPEAAKVAAKAVPVARPAVPPKPALPADVGTNTGLHLPRFAALKTDDVNMRSGPGERYPVQWTYKRRDLPVEIEREFDVWRLVEDMDGVKGWVHQATLTGRRGFVITGTEPRTLRAVAAEDSVPVAVLKPGVIGRLRSCDAAAEWCQVQVGDYRGWLKRTDFWGSAPGEAVQP